MTLELDHTRRAQEDLRETLQLQLQESMRTQSDQLLALIKSLMQPQAPKATDTANAPPRENSCTIDSSNSRIAQNLDLDVPKLSAG